MKTLLNHQIIKSLESNGFTLKAAINSSNNVKGIFDSLFSVNYNNTKILYLRKNENDKFDTIELLKYPSSFPKSMINISMEKVIEILKTVVTNNFQ